MNVNGKVFLQLFNKRK